MLSFILFFGVAQVIEALAIFAFRKNQKSIPFSTLEQGSVNILSQPIPVNIAIRSTIA